MNILFVHEIDWFRPYVFEIHEWAELLSKMGHNVYVVDFEDSWKRESLFDFGYIKSKKFPKVSRVYQDGYVDVIRPGFIKLPLIDRASAYLSHHKVIDRLIQEKKINVIMLYSVPTNGKQVIKLARKHKIPIIFRSIDTLHGLVPEFFKKQTYKMEKHVYANVNNILALTPELQEYVIRMGASPENVEVIYCGIDTNRFNPNITCDDLRKQLHLKKTDDVIIYIGTFFGFSGLDVFVEKMPKLIKENPNAKLLLVGGGPLENKLKQQVKILEIENIVIFTGFRPFDEMPKFINLSDICINPFQICDATVNIIPGKLFQYLACKKPIVATELPGVKSLLKDEKYGIIHCDNMDALVEHILILLENNEKRKNIANMGYNYVYNNHRIENIVKKVEKLLIQKIKF